MIKFQLNWYTRTMEICEPLKDFILPVNQTFVNQTYVNQTFVKSGDIR